MIPHGPRCWELSQQAASLFPSATSFGLDVLPRSCRKRFTLLEANAFGDYLPGLKHRGMSTYEAELRSLLQCEGSRA